MLLMHLVLSQKAPLVMNRTRDTDQLHGNAESSVVHMCCDHVAGLATNKRRDLTSQSLIVTENPVSLWLCGAAQDLI
jgi:hypothetical protein